MLAKTQRANTQDTPAALGFGCMRLPTLELPAPDKESAGSELACASQVAERESVIDLAQLCDMVDVFLGAGFTYFDTARGYHQGGAEGALKRALVDRYPRESFELATKLPAYLAPNAAAAERMFFISLEDTRAGYFNRYLLHNLGGSRTAYFEKYGIWEFVREQQVAGLIDEVGFSFHGTPEELEQLLELYPFVDFVQLQINYLDWNDALIQACRCYEVARSFERTIVVMEPLKGGLLAQLPPSIEQQMRQGRQLHTHLHEQASQRLGEQVSEQQATGMDHIALALRFAASLEGVTTVLSGMSTLAQMEQNTTIMQQSAPLSAYDRAMLARVTQAFQQLDTVACTNCGYCREVCPQGVYLPQAIHALNTLVLFEDITRARQNYLWATPGKASLCTQCGACEAVCPQHIPLIKVLKRATKELEGEAFRSVHT